MAAESSTAIVTSMSGSNGVTWSTIYLIFIPRVASEQYFVYKNFNYSNVNEVCRRIRACNGFHKIVTAKPDLFFMNQVATFYIFWCKTNPTDLSPINFQLTSSSRDQEPELNVLEAIKMPFDLNEAGDFSLDDISLTDLQSIYEEMVIPNLNERTYQLKAFLRTRLTPVYRKLFDLVHRVFLSQTRTNDQVLIYKFRILTAVYLNLNINWARIFLVNMMDEIKNIKHKFDSKGAVTELVVKNKLNFCNKISLINLKSI